MTEAVLPEIAAAAGIHPPALLIIGEVVSLADKLNWFAGATPVETAIANP